MYLNNLQREYHTKVICSRSGKFYIALNIIHVLIILGGILYPFLTKKNKYDPVFLIFFYLIIIQWITLKDECLLNYIEKKKIDSNYKLGSNTESPGINYILSNINISLYSSDNTKKCWLNIFVPILSFILFSYVAIRYTKSNINLFILTFIYGLLVYILLFKVKKCH